MKMTAALFTLVFAISAFAMTPQETVQLQKQYREIFSRRFAHALDIAGMKKLTPAQQQKLNQAADKFSSEVLAELKKMNKLDLLQKVCKDPEITRLQEKVLKTRTRPEFIAAAKEFSAYVSKKFPLIADTQSRRAFQAPYMTFRKSIEDLRVTPTLNEKEDYLFWSSVIILASR